MFTNTIFFETQEARELGDFKAKVLSEYNSNEVGYYHLPKSGEQIISSVKKFASELKNIKYVVVIGVGGSSLGAKAISHMLYHDKVFSAPELLFLENTDPVAINKTLSNVKFSQSLFLFISKSGTTLDTVSIAKIVVDKMQITLKSPEFRARFAVITDENSELHKFAQDFKLQSFFIPKNVGGRFSFLSAAGLVPLTLCGYDTSSLVDGAKKCVNDFLQDGAQILQKARAYTNGAANINVVFSYADALRHFNEWYIQLWAESLGKKKNGKSVGLTPVGLIGAIDQHSFLQLIIEGPKDKTVTFIRVKEMRGDLLIPSFSFPHLEKADLKSNISAAKLLNEQSLATMKSLIAEDVMCDEIALDRLDAFHAGYLMYYYEILTSVCGVIYGINTYNQPGVEIGKKILLSKLAKPR